MSDNHKVCDALGFEEFSWRAGEGTPFAATLTCTPIGDDETGSLWAGRILFDNNNLNWARKLPKYDGGDFVMYEDWLYPHEKSGGTHLMNLLDKWHGEIVELFERVRTTASEEAGE
jgi:hypothetical protein